MQIIRFPFALLLLAGLLPAAPSAAQQAAGAWQTVETVNTPTPRHESAFTEVGGKFYLLGGRGIKPVEIYDPATRRWTTGATPPFQMHHFQAVPHEGKIYVVSAWTTDYPREEGLTHVYIYDPAADAWTQGPEIPEGRRRGAAGAVAHEGRIYIAGGNAGGHGPHARAVGWLDAFDPETGRWTTLAPAPHARDHFQAAVVDDRLYLAGGRRSEAGTFSDSTVAAVDVYDFTRGTWRTLQNAPIPTERAGTTAAAVGDEVIVIGGEGFGRAWGTTEVLDTKTGIWRTAAPLNQPRHGMQALVYDGKVYVAAGAGAQGGSPELSSMEAFAF